MFFAFKNVKIHEFAKISRFFYTMFCKKSKSGRFEIIIMYTKWIQGVFFLRLIEGRLGIIKLRSKIKNEKREKNLHRLDF
jgi:hypothetical protein